MKQLGKRSLSLLLALVLTAGLLPASAMAAQSGTYQMISQDQRDSPITDTYSYSDDWFRSPSTVRNGDLAALSAMAAAASQVSPENQHSDYLTAFLEDLGFEDIIRNRYAADGAALADSMGCVIGHKTIRDGLETDTLLAVIPRSAGSKEEWAGNFTLGADGIPAGFLAARDEVLRFLKQYLADQDITGSIKLWSAGYSRGAAVANLLGGFLAGGSGYLDGVKLAPEDLYVYTIATPFTLPMGTTLGHALSVSGARDGQYGDRDTPGAAYVYEGADSDQAIDPAAQIYGGIHSYLAQGDYVTLLPPENWGFSRYGVVEEANFSGEEMSSILETLSPHIQAKFPEAGYTARHPWKTFTADPLLRLADDPDHSGSVSPEELVQQRLTHLMTRVDGRDAYVSGGYQEVLAAASVLLSFTKPDFSSRISEDPGALVKAALLTYLAYGVEQVQKENPGISEADAAAQVIRQLLALFGDRSSAASDAIWLRLFEPLLPTEFSVESTIQIQSENAQALVRTFVEGVGGCSLLDILLPDASSFSPLDLLAFREREDPAADLMELLLPGKSISEAADTAVSDWVSTMTRDLPSSLSPYQETLRENPAILRTLLASILFADRDSFDASADLRDMATLLDQLPALSVAHYHELYVAWMKSQRGEANQETPVSPEPEEPVHDCPSAAFSDVDTGSWYHQAVDYALENGLMNGTSGTTFRPNDTLSRAMLSTILWRLEGSPSISTRNPFPDLKEGQWYTEPVLWTSLTGVVRGYDDGSFRPDRNVSRQEMAAMLQRYAMYKGYDTSASTDLSAYSDAAEIGGWAMDAMAWANAVGLITGKADTVLDPRGNTTRAETAAILMRFIEGVDR